MVLQLSSDTGRPSDTGLPQSRDDAEHDDDDDTTSTSNNDDTNNISSSNNNSNHNHNNNDRKRNTGRVKRKYKRKSIPETERQQKNVRQERQAEYEQLMSSGPSIWRFENLFPDPVWDESTVQRDLFAVKKQDGETQKVRANPAAAAAESDSATAKMKSSLYGGNSMLRVWREPKLNGAIGDNGEGSPAPTTRGADAIDESSVVSEFLATTGEETTTGKNTTSEVVVDHGLTRMVEDRMFGYRRTQTGGFQYETSLLGEGAVRFREGVRLGNPLQINTDRLNYLAKKELQHGRVDEAVELYQGAIDIDPRDGRGYLGLSRCAQRRRDFTLAREYLKVGIKSSVSVSKDDLNPDRGANPFLLQALGVLEEKMGRLTKAEALYIAAARSRPSHAAAWVALAQLRTQKLGQSANAGRVCFQTAERELKKDGLPQSSHVYTAWASLEYNKAGDQHRSRVLFNKALEIDPRCSAAWLQLGVMEGKCENWDDAQACFDSALKFDRRNSRVLQAYALMETRRPEGESRTAIGLFERALKANPRDAGVLQPYALYVAELGDYRMARELLRRGTQVNKRHSAVWQAWGVLETRHGKAQDARKVFQRGIWACAQGVGGQSGGYRCARLWQAWGVLEAREGDHAAARRCFSRALDADSRNVAAVTAWAHMEEDLDNLQDARSIFERALRQFSAGSDEKTAIWRGYELMEQRLGYTEEALQVFQRSMREAITKSDEAMVDDEDTSVAPTKKEKVPEIDEVLQRSNEVEVVRWEGSSGEVWMNDKAIEGKVPFDMKKRNRKEM